MSAQSQRKIKVKLSSLEALGLHDTSAFMDGQDPQLVVKIGSQEAKTDRQVDSISNAKFPETIEMEITETEYNGDMQVTVNDVTAGGKVKNVVGQASVKIKNEIPKFNEPTQVVIKLTYLDKKKGPTQEGIVRMKALLEYAPDPIKPAEQPKPQASPSPAPEVPNSKEPAAAAAPSVAPAATAPAKGPAEQPTAPAKQEPPVAAAAAAPTSAPAQPSAAADGKVSPKTVPPGNKAVAPAAGDKTTSPPPATAAAAAAAPSSTPAAAVAPKATAPPTVSSRPAGKIKAISLHVNNIHARDLVDTGNFMDKQDPAVRIKVGKTEHITARQQDKGCNADFPEIFAFDIDPAAYESGLEVEVEVLNINGVTGGKTHVGLGKIALKEAVPEFNSSTLFTIPLKYNRKQDKGTVAMNGRLNVEMEPAASADAKAEAAPAVKKDDKAGPRAAAASPTAATADNKLPASEKSNDAKTAAPASDAKPIALNLRIDQMKAMELFDTGHMLDRQDPAIVMKVGRLEFNTERVKDAGAIAEFPETFVIPVDPAVLDKGLELEVDVLNLDANKKFKAHIGKGKLVIRDKFKKFNEFVNNVTVDLMVEKTKAQKGKVTFRGYLEAVYPSASDGKSGSSSSSASTKATGASAKNAPPPFQTGKFLVKKVVCQELVNVETAWGKNDPYVIVQLGAEKRQTEHQKEKGAEATFDYLDMNFDVDEDIVLNDPVRVFVWDKNDYNKDVLIGEADHSIQFLLTQDTTKQPFELRLALTKDKKPMGRVVLFVQLIPQDAIKAESSKDRDISEELKGGGVLCVNRVRAFEVKNKHGMFSSAVSSPFCRLNFAAFEHTTPVLDLSRTNNQMIFDNLELEIDATREQLSSGLLNVEIVNKGLMRHVMVGKGAVAVKPSGFEPGKEVELHVDLADGGTTTGRVVVYCTARKKEPKLAPADIKIQEDFELGFARITEITGHDLKNTEWFGKQDPYVKLSFANGENWQAKTTVKQDQGSEVHWENQDFQFNVSKPELLANKELLVEVWDHNDVTPHVLIGKGSVSIKSAASVVDTDTKLTVSLLGKDGKTAGKVSFMLVVRKAVQVSKLKIPDGFLEGCFKIHKIAAHQLPKGGMFSKLQPVVQVMFGADFKATTAVGRDPEEPVWDVLNIVSPTYSVAELTKQPLSVELLNGSKVIATGTVENLMLPASKLSEWCEIDVKLESKGGSSGRLTLHLMVDNPPPVVKAEDAVIERKPAFERGVLLIKYIKGTNLKNVELVGKQDPFIEFEYGDWTEETEPLMEAGGDVQYDNLEFSTDVTAHQLMNEEMLVKVWDKNEQRANVIIGTARVNMKRLAFTLGKEVELPIELSDAAGRPAGSLLVRTEIRERGKDPHNKALPAGFTSGIVHIHKIQTFNLRNTEIMGSPDPFVAVKLNKDLIDRTRTLADVKGDALFDLLDIKVEVSAFELQTQQLNIEVWDENTGRPNALVGTGSARMTDICEYGKSVEIPVKLKTEKGAAAGRVLLFARLEQLPVKDEDVSKIEVSKDFKKGKMFIQKISAYKLYNTEIFTKQDPYVVVNTSDGWSAKTLPVNNAGENCIWNMLDMVMPVPNKAVLETTMLNVTVKNSNYSTDVDIGSGSVSLRRASSALNTIFELTVDLKNPKCKKPSAGSVTLFVEIRNEEDESDWKMPESFEFGTFKVTSLKAFNLKNTETGRALGDKPDPFFVFHLGDTWTEKNKTPAKGNVIEAEWEDLDLACDVYRSDVLNSKVEVVYWDENFNGDYQVATASFGLMKCVANLGTVCEMSVDLLDAAQKPAGKVIVLGRIDPPEPDADLPPTFEAGLMKIKKISAFSIKNSGWFRKGDPFVKVKFNEFTKSTPALNNTSDATWSNLDYAFNVNRRNIAADQITLEAWEHNTSGAVKLFDCLIPLKKAGARLEQEVEVTGLLKDAKGKDGGRVKVTLQLTAVAALSKPDLGLPKDFKTGIILITAIKASKLANTEIFGKQDPYVRLSMGDWNEATETMDNAGSNATWSNLDIQCEVNEEMLCNEDLKVEVWEENTATVDVSLGKGTVSVRKLCARMNDKRQTTDLTVPLSIKGAIKGELIVSAVLMPGSLEEAADGLPESAVTVKNGTLCIKKIQSFDLKGGDSSFAILGNKPDPYVMLELLDWKGRTDPIKNGGRNVTWSDIADLEAPVTGDTLKYKRLQVTVMDDNLFKDSWMSQGSMSLRKLGSQPEKSVSQMIRLKDRRGQFAGKMEITGTVKAIAEVPKGPDGAPTFEGPVKGQLVLKSCALAGLRNVAPILVVQDLYLKIRCGGFNYTSSLKKDAGVKTSIPLKTQTDMMATAQMLTTGLNINILSKGLYNPAVPVGMVQVPLINVLKQPNQEVTVKAPVLFENAQAGVCNMTLAFVPDGSDISMMLGDEEVPEDGKSGKGTSGANQLQLSEMEERLRKQLEQEMAAMTKQNAELTKSVERLNQQLARERRQQEGLVIQQINDIKLPSDIKSWRNAHVQAWVGFKMELPKLMDKFKEASVDGLLLITHLTENMLESELQIDNALNRDKIWAGIKQLRAEQKEYDEAAEKDRLRRLKRQQEEEERRRKALEDLEWKKPKKDKKEKKKKNKKTGQPKTFFGEIREQNEIDRARIKREMDQYRKDKAGKQQEADLKSKTWSFEYTGKPPPKLDTLYDEDPFQHILGTKSYQNVMSLDILNSNNFTKSSIGGDAQKAPHFTKVRMIPANCSTEEVLAVVKGAMFDLSNWLVECERINYQKQLIADSDLLDSRDEHLLKTKTRATAAVYESRKFNTSLKSISSDAGKATPSGSAKRPASAPTAKKLTSNSEDDEGNDNEDGPDSDEESLNFKDIEGQLKDDDGEGDDDVDDEELDFHEAMQGLIDADDDNNEADELPPPADEDMMHLQASQPRPPSAQIAALLEAEARTLRQPPAFDRMALVFKALVGQENNNARWLGSNDKLTRLKLEGGMESLLRVSCNWSQFDTLWTRLDYKRSGDIDLREFKEFFGDLSEFEFREGAQTLSLKSGSKAISALQKCLYELCDALRHAGFTVIEMFSGFDRNGSGDISMSEFCSMLRLVVGNNFDKRLIYQGLNVLDSDGNKSISLNELLAFVYRIWKTQLDDLAGKLNTLDDRMTGDSELIQRIIHERKIIKDAIKKNFPRQWRDRLEREGGANGHNIPGPFQALLKRMDIGTTTDVAGMTQTLGTTGSFEDLRQMEGGDETGGHLNLGSPSRPYRPSETATSGTFGAASTAVMGLSGKIPGSPKKSGASLRAQRTRSANVSGHNQIMRFKIKVPAGEPPTRVGATLQIPQVYNVNKGLRVQSQETAHILNQNDDGFGGF